MSENLEQAIVRAGANRAPRVTLEQIVAEIEHEHYFTAAEGVFGAACRHVPGTPDALNLLTFCVLTLRNGFTVTGESACASPENFNEEIGRRIARENAVAKVWPLLGYQLREQLFHAQHDTNAP